MPEAETPGECGPRTSWITATSPWDTPPQPEPQPEMEPDPDWVTNWGKPQAQDADDRAVVRADQEPAARPAMSRRVSFRRLINIGAGAAPAA